VTRTLMLAVAASLALPVLALAALIGQQEYRAFVGQVLSVPVRGVDPRDLLQGHYLVAAFDWDWQPEPASSGAGALCVLPSPDDSNTRPKVRFVAGWKPGNGMAEGCKLMIAGIVRGTVDGAAAFVPEGLDAGYFSVHLFVPETRARELEKIVRDRPTALAVDLAVSGDGHAVVRRVRLDGQPIQR
jgi:hypothetical protein